MKTGIIFSTIVFMISFQSVAFAIRIKEAVFKTRSAGTVVFNHAEHLKQSGITHNCRICHSAIFDLKKKTRHSMAEMEKGESCGACHNGKKAFPLKDCLKCHQAGEISFEDKSYGSVKFSHKSHMESHTCTDCHKSLYKTSRSRTLIPMKSMEKGKSCGACHNGKQAFPLKDCLKCHHAEELVFVEKSTGDVRFSHKKHMEASGCGDCHPTIYKTARNKVKVSMEAMEKGKSCGSCHDGKTAFSVKEKCEGCHKS
ncbi:MAG: cytochrome c3 family protein [Geobacteraceae bacterium]|nr:cytochrome c3 family protein [Geobacteraceae bacterium]